MIKVIDKFKPNPYDGIEVDTTSRGSFKDLSPFYLGPYHFMDIHGNQRQALNVENLWQYSKVYPEHVDINGNPTQHWQQWSQQGMMNRRAIRYPMGKGKTPCYSYWMGEKIDYISARKKLYIPAYSQLVTATKSYALLYKWVMEGHNIILRDFDGYDHHKLGMSLIDVVNNTQKSLGHAFVLYGLLTGKINSMYDF